MIEALFWVGVTAGTIAAIALGVAFFNWLDGDDER